MGKESSLEVFTPDLNFKVVWTVEEYFVDFEVYEVIGWTENNEPLVIDDYNYAKGTVRWDGCANILFSEGNYAHFCAKEDVESHCTLLKSLYGQGTVMLAGAGMMESEGEGK